MEESTREIVNKEKSGIVSNRGIDEYAEGFGMNREQFIKWLSAKKRVLDISSGGGRLKQELEILKNNGDFKSDVQIISFDISYALPEGIDNTRYSTHLAYSQLGVPVTSKDIERTHTEFKKGAVAGSYTNLPFSNNYFDGVLASASFGISVQNKDQLNSAYREVHRVLEKNNGSGFITVVTDPDNPNGLRIGSGGKEIKYNINEIAFLSPSLHQTIAKSPQGETVTVHFLEIGAQSSG